MKPSELAEWMHEGYERFSKKYNWKTQEKCRVKFKDLPKENQRVMIQLAESILLKFIDKEEVLTDINTAKRCMDYQHISCKNNDCKNLICPLNKKYRTKIKNYYYKEIAESEKKVKESSKREKVIHNKLRKT